MRDVTNNYGYTVGLEIFAVQTFSWFRDLMYYMPILIYIPPVAYHQLLLISIVTKNNNVFTNVGCLASWWFSNPGLPLIIG